MAAPEEHLDRGSPRAHGESVSSTAQFWQAGLRAAEPQQACPAAPCPASLLPHPQARAVLPLPMAEALGPQASTSFQTLRIKGVRTIVLYGIT